MHYCSPRRPKNAVIFVRDDPDHPYTTSSEIQQLICERYCNSNRIPISRVIRENCDAEEAVRVLHRLLLTLPEDVDAVYAARADFFTDRFRELGLLCLQFQCRNIWLYSLDAVGPLSWCLPGIEPKDLLEADRRFLDEVRHGKENESS